MRESCVSTTQLVILIKNQISHLVSLTRLCTLVRIQLDFHRESVSLLGRLFACHFIHRSLSHLLQYLKLFGFGQVPTSIKETVSSPKSVLRRHSAPPEKIR
jgi:hypothetical protein